MHSNRYIDKTYMEVLQISAVEARLTVSGILCADKKSKNVRLVENLLYIYCKISP